MIYILSEGMLRGVVNDIPLFFKEDFKNIGNAIRGAGDLSKNPDKVSEIVKKWCDNLRDRLSKFGDFIIPEKRKKRDAVIGPTQRVFKWRHYVFLKDDVYEEALEKAKKGEARSKWLDIKFSNRKIDDMWKVRNKEELIKLVNKYEERVNDVVNLSKKDPTNKGFSALLSFALYGLGDMAYTFVNMANYAEVPGSRK